MAGRWGEARFSDGCPWLRRRVCGPRAERAAKGRRRPGQAGARSPAGGRRSLCRGFSALTREPLHVSPWAAPSALRSDGAPASARPPRRWAGGSGGGRRPRGGRAGSGLLVGDRRGAGRRRGARRREPQRSAAFLGLVRLRSFGLEAFGSLETSFFPVDG